MSEHSSGCPPEHSESKATLGPEPSAASQTRAQPGPGQATFSPHNGHHPHPGYGYPGNPPHPGELPPHAVGAPGYLPPGYSPPGYQPPGYQTHPTYPGWATPAAPGAPYPNDPYHAPYPGHSYSSGHQSDHQASGHQGHGQRNGMSEFIEEIASGGNGLNSLGRLLNFEDTDFWKGALVGAAAVMLLSNDGVRNLLFGGGKSDADKAAAPAETDT
ncbi:hypothetical protein Thiowin_03835 [Thiorhodovibrio winogradskyi]|uniref:Uncharacterized protein n=1 Tax=Thiorhodovibrio winogradskyi TaxID=77007 RepID=A0ABZ0SGI3_9GAMM|nr:hypothetical protein [Thiorhodovibrio winogradskyi]